MNLVINQILFYKSGTVKYTVCRTDAKSGTAFAGSAAHALVPRCVQPRLKRSGRGVERVRFGEGAWLLPQMTRESWIAS